MNGSDAAERRVAELREQLDLRRRHIDETLADIEERLAPARVADRITARVEEAVRPWRERPGAELELLTNDVMTRIRELAWLNPPALGLVAAAVGFFLGRRFR